MSDVTKHASYQKKLWRHRTIHTRIKRASKAKQLNRLISEFKALYFHKWCAELVSQKTCRTPATLISQTAIEVDNLKMQLQQLFDCIEAIDTRLDRLLQSADAMITENTEIFSELSTCIELVQQRQEEFEKEIKIKLQKSCEPLENKN